MHSRSGATRRKGLRLALAAAAFWAAAIWCSALAPPAAAADEVDTALIVSVDVSNSVDEQRYRLQMEGIAAALEDPGVISAILNGSRGAILIMMVQWADKPVVSLPWTRVASAAEAKAVAARVRKLPRHDGEFTCMSKMMRFVADKISPAIPAKALRVVVDVSGDGIDNCNGDETTPALRDELVGYGIIINGLPILENADGKGPAAADAASPPGTVLAAPNADTIGLEPWYRANVIGGPGAFVLPAYGYSDFGRAIRQKFVVEVSDAREPPSRTHGNSWNIPAAPIRVMVPGD